ncbi:conserved hypothetical protein [Neospora caninum Liverpool]|uniref:Uncharacterized protein n=1 Tax=Neospora caninum (strain Liverpool) TaxID=572307 RepID=F0VPL9_NEOCL|nr:conserved hypothetical protein [Neospora caninum Liverpool]CBZ55666.1 conserved hypothetical protein [Neospora caninum Liverpool]CEL70408.1 TPA: hypothetical protein BN1204_060900 [Neospora caninum Liverpool]|eukprot:XP_003885692.1 conserved hypothetical protein [Neospora caninum Liverpool]
MGNEVASHHGAPASPSHAFKARDRSGDGTNDRQRHPEGDFSPEAKTLGGFRQLLARRNPPSCAARPSSLCAELPAAAAVLNGQYPFLLFASAEHLIPLEAAVASSSLPSVSSDSSCASSPSVSVAARERRENEENPLLSLLSFDETSAFPRSGAALDVSTYDVALLRDAVTPATDGRRGRERGDSLLAWPPQFPAFLPPGRAIDTNQIFVAYGVKGGVRVMPIVGSAEGGVEETYKAPLYVPPSANANASKPSAVSVALYQGTKPQFLLVADSNNLVSIFKLAPPVSSQKAGCSGGASAFLLLQLPNPQPLAPLSPRHHPLSSSTFVAWIPPHAGGPQDGAQAGREQSYGLSLSHAGDVYFVTVQRHQVVLWSLPVLRSYCISKNINFAEQPLQVDDAVVSCCACVLPLRDALASAASLEKLSRETSRSRLGAGLAPFLNLASTPPESSLFSLPPSTSSFSFASSPFALRQPARQQSGLFASDEKHFAGAETLSVNAVSFCPASRSILVAFNERCVAAWHIEPSHNKVPRVSLIGAQFVPPTPIPPAMNEVAASILGRPLPDVPEEDCSVSLSSSATDPAPSLFTAAGEKKAFNPFDEFLVQAASSASSAEGRSVVEEKKEAKGGEQEGDSHARELLSALTCITSINVLYATVYRSEEESKRGQETLATGATAETALSAESSDAGRRVAFLLVGTANNSCLRVFPLFLSREDLSSNPFFPSARPLPLLFGSAVQTLVLDAAAPLRGVRTPRSRTAATVSAGESPEQTHAEKAESALPTKADDGFVPPPAKCASELPWAFVRVDAARHAVLWSLAGCGAPESMTVDDPETGDSPANLQKARERQSGRSRRGASTDRGVSPDGDGDAPAKQDRDAGISKDSFIFVLEVNQRMVHCGEEKQQSETENASESEAGEREAKTARLLRRASHLPLPSLLVLPSQFPVKNVSSVFSLSGAGALATQRPSLAGGPDAPSPSLSFAEFEAEAIGAGEVAIYSFFVKQADKARREAGEAGREGRYDLVQGHSHRTLQQLFRQPSIQWMPLDAFSSGDGAAAEPSEREGVRHSDVNKTEEADSAGAEEETRSATAPCGEQSSAEDGAGGAGSREEKETKADDRARPVSSPPFPAAGVSGLGAAPLSKEAASREILMRLLGKTSLPNLPASSVSSSLAPPPLSLAASAAPVAANATGRREGDPTEETHAEGNEQSRGGQDHAGMPLGTVSATSREDDSDPRLADAGEEAKETERGTEKEMEMEKEREGSKGQDGGRKGPKGSDLPGLGEGAGRKKKRTGGSHASPVLSAAQPPRETEEKGDAFEQGRGRGNAGPKSAAASKAKGEERGDRSAAVGSLQSDLGEKCASSRERIETPGSENVRDTTQPSVASEASIRELITLLKASRETSQLRCADTASSTHGSARNPEHTGKDDGEAFERAIDGSLRRCFDAVHERLLTSLAPELAAQVAASLLASGATPAASTPSPHLQKASEERGKQKASEERGKQKESEERGKQKEMLKAVLAPVVAAELGTLFSEHVVPGLKEAVRAGLADVKAVVATKLAEVRRQSAAEIAALDRNVQQVQASLQQNFQRVQKQLESQAPLQRQNSVSAQSVDSMRQNLAALEAGLKVHSEAVMKAVEGVSQTLAAMQRQQGQYQTQVAQQFQQQQRELQAQKQKVDQVVQSFRQLRQDFRADLTKTEQTLKERSETLAASAAAAAVSAALGSSPHTPGAATALASTTAVGASAGAGPGGSRSEAGGGDAGGAGEKGETGRLPRREESEEEKLKKRLVHCLQTQNFEEAFSLSIAADLQQSTGGSWLLSICSYFSPAQFFEREPLPVGQPALLGTVKILSEGLKADLRERKLAAVEQRVAWISEALFQIDGPMPQIGRSDFLDLVDEFRTNLTWAQQHVKKEGERDCFPQPIEEGLALSLKQLKRLQRTAETTRAS